METPDVLAAVEEISQALEASAGRGDLAEAAVLVARRASLVQALAKCSATGTVSHLERIRSAGERAAASLRAHRARDLVTMERLRQVAAATAPAPASNTTVLCIG